MAVPALTEILQQVLGSLHGLPTPVAMGLPFVAGLVIGYMVKKVLKIAVVGGLILVAAIYFGFFSLSSTAAELEELIIRYGPTVIQFAALVFGILPMGLGFIIGFTVGFLVSR